MSPFKQKYILTQSGKDYFFKQKKSIMGLAIESMISQTLFRNDVLKGKPFTIKTLKLLKGSNKILMENVHYIEYNSNITICINCKKELYNTQPHNCNQ